MDYDVLVVGGGTAGMEAALSLGDMGYSVLLAEQQASIGGTMILLSKVFPTLDCASCIATPKMAAAFHHPQVTTWTSTEVDEIRRDPDGTFRASLTRKATCVDPAKCTGCQQCELACTVAIPDQFNFGLVGRRAAYIPFSQAVPKKAVIDRYGDSPCTFACPAGIKAHGYVSLVRSGLFDAAMELILEDVPIPGCLGRACYAPCEEVCSRRELEGEVPIRLLKRFVADRYYAAHPEPAYGAPEQRRDGRVAVVGSGPAGLAAAYDLARKGYSVTIFEAAEQAGGMLRYAIPSYRLPNEVVDRDIANVTALGVEIRTGHRVESIGTLESAGFDAVFLACGTSRDRALGIEGEDQEGVVSSLAFLNRVNRGEAPDLRGKRVVVVGGGNVAIDSARVARRLGAQSVTIQYRRTRDEMPAFAWEIEGAVEEGVSFEYLRAPVRFVGENGALTGVESIDMRLGEPDESGRRRPVPVPGSERISAADLVVTAVGLETVSDLWAGDPRVGGRGTIAVDPLTLQTTILHVFAGGDCATGPTSIVAALGQGRRAAYFIDCLLSGRPLDGDGYDHRLAPVSHEVVLGRQASYRTAPADGKRERPGEERQHDFTETELALDEQQARAAAGRCLDCGGCCECHQCLKACPAEAIDFSQRDRVEQVHIGSVVVSTGFHLFDALRKPQYGYGRYPNVITAMQMDRLLTPTRPYDTVLRPSDGRIPESIAYVLCTGSRDCGVGNDLCSRVCCMYSIKQAELIMGALPLADITIYFIDIRAFGKGFDEFYEQARSMGVYFVKGRVARIEEAEGDNLALVYEDIANGGKVARAEHDLVVLSVGLLPNQDALRLFSNGDLRADEHHYVLEIDEDQTPARTSIEGVYAAGSSAAVMDIPDTILHAASAAALAGAYVERLKA
ncbi:MAG: FAD-dependent oxidoreductase [Acidimicrobiia bacterium]|nr:FAD-dependent oxidoreductase [Acidimicrobiia bacterium]